MPRTLTWLALLYLALSGICFVAHDVPALRSLVSANWNLTWLLGPPGSLLYQWRAVPAYLGETAILGALVGTGAGVFSVRRWPPAALLISIGAAAFWVLCGLFTWASTT